MSNQHGLNVTKPVSLLNRSIKFSFKDFFKSMTKAVVKGATANYALALGDVVDALASATLVKDCGEVAWLLIQRSLLQAVHDLLKENEALIYRDAGNPMVILSKRGLPPDDPDAVTARLDLSLEEGEITIDENFFRHPRTLPVLEQFKTPFREWLDLFGLNPGEAASIANRLPSYFVHALGEQWRARGEEYACLKEAFDTPFTNAGVAEQAWQSYAAFLQKQVDGPMFVEAFSLRQVYVPLRAFFTERDAAEKEARFDPRTAEALNVKLTVVSLEEEVNAWLADADPKGAVRIISGGPGSGKSSFARILAAELAERNERRVLFVPLYQLTLSDDLEKSVADYISYAAPGLTNPLTREQQAGRWLVIFDGLDELAMQGKLAAEIAAQFVREVQAKAELINLRANRLKVLISGRELAVQSGAADFKTPGQILHVLPYLVPEAQRGDYEDARGLLAEDQRQRWWAKYGEASGRGYGGLPPELNRGELEEVTSQPLLNYLVALSHARGRVDLATESNLNLIYRDLLRAVYERDWGGGSHPALEGVSEEKFVRWLEEIAVSAWHGDGRTTTVEEIKAHTEGSAPKNLLTLLEEGADKGITRLLMAFYFRRAGARDSGDKTFEFTHKSFGEYLAARRIVRFLADTHEELARHHDDGGKGWDERTALVRWVKLFGPSPLDDDLFRFVENEVRIAGKEKASGWQKTLSDLIGFELRAGLPMESLSLPTFKEMTRQARNAEESLLVVLHACALTTRELSNISWPAGKSRHSISFGELISRLVGQRESLSIPFVLKHLGFLNLERQYLMNTDFSGADFEGANLSEGILRGMNLRRAILTAANLSEAFLSGAKLVEADLTGADLSKAVLRGGLLVNSRLGVYALPGANVTRASLRGANLNGAVLRGLTFDRKTKFVGATFEGTEFGDETQKQAILKAAGISEEDTSPPDAMGELKKARADSIARFP
jgi:uncharacterized protein YjbI with pentapeptide repeats